MAGTHLRVALLALLAGSSLAVAQPTPPVPPKPAAKPPVVQPRPGATGRPPHHARPQHAAPARPATPPLVAAPAVPPPPPPPEPEKPAEPEKGTNTGLALPRFATLRSEEVNLRTGPGTRYPIEWVYKRRDLPVQIQREFEVWRLVQDQEGVRGWVHQAVLAPRRAGIVVGGEQTLRHDPRDDAAAVAQLKPGVILRLRACEAASDWCQAGVQDYRGWIKRSQIWGTFPGEAIQ